MKIFTRICYFLLWKWYKCNDYLYNNLMLSKIDSIGGHTYFIQNFETCPKPIRLIFWRKHDNLKWTEIKSLVPKYVEWQCGK